MVRPSSSPARRRPTVVLPLPLAEAMIVTRFTGGGLSPVRRIAPCAWSTTFDEAATGGRELLGGKGVGLAEMTQLGVPVPAGFTITTGACRA